MSGNENDDAHEYRQCPGSEVNYQAAAGAQARNSDIDPVERVDHAARR